uniref:MHC class II antigen alpha chain n=2 Tax=Hippocampus abdominalis TaxID=109274 RepID=A0A0A7TWC3_HIPAB|nr:MHC class II antigen alpha chain [Hippocampus abdominalis]
MKALVFLVLLLRCGDAAADVIHTDMQMIGCSETEGAFDNSLDEEDVFVVDFIAERVVDKQPSFVDHVILGKDTFQVAMGNLIACRRNLNITQKALKDQPLESDPPSHPIIYPEDNVALGEKNSLVCHVSGFFPAPVKVHWTKNGEPVAGAGTRATSAFPDKDGSFHQTFQLDFTPAQDDIYSCVVEHPALERPRNTFWTVTVNQPGIGATVFCALGLTVGLVGVATGTFFLIKGNQCN